MRFVHIVNPYDPGPSENELRLQRLTMSALINASRHAYTSDQVTLCATYYKDDELFIPAEFRLIQLPERSINDVAGFESRKRLPLMQDILKGLIEFHDADYFVYTNMDILLSPQFYEAVSQILRIEKQEALIINRRRIPEEFVNRPEEIFKQDGLPHPGYDCFVFHRSLLNKLEFGNAVVGVPGIGFLLAHNLFLRSESCSVITDKHLTYHLGMEIVKPWAEKEVVKFQHDCIRAFLKRYKSEFRVKNFPGYDWPFFKRHRYWLMNPLFSYPMMLRLDLPNLFDGRKTNSVHKAGYSWKETNFAKVQ